LNQSFEEEEVEEKEEEGEYIILYY